MVPQRPGGGLFIACVAEEAADRLTLISGNCKTSGKVLMQLEWAASVCKRWQLRMVVGTAFSLLPLRSSSSSCSSRASLLQQVEMLESVLAQVVSDPDPVSQYLAVKVCSWLKAKCSTRSWLCPVSSDTHLSVRLLLVT